MGIVENPISDFKIYKKSDIEGLGFFDSDEGRFLNNKLGIGLILKVVNSREFRRLSESRQMLMDGGTANEFTKPIEILMVQEVRDAFPNMTPEVSLSVVKAAIEVLTEPSIVDYV